MTAELSLDDLDGIDGLDIVEEKRPNLPPPIRYTPSPYRDLLPKKNFVMAEEAIIGAILVDEHVLDSILDIAPPEMFTDSTMKIVYQGILVLRERKQAIDAVTVAGYLHSREYYGMGPALIIATDACISSSHGQHYAKIVAGVHYEKQVLALANKFTETQERADLDNLSKALMAKERLGLPPLFSYQKNLHGVLDEIMAQANLPTSDTGFKILDEVLLGTRGGEVIVWGAAPNAGKSITLLNVMHATVKTKRCLYGGTEMSAIETVQRHLSVENGIEPWKLRKGKVSADEIRSLTASLGDVMSLMPLYIMDLPAPTISDIDAAITASDAEVVFLDYLEMFTLPAAENYRLQITEFMRQLKNLARRRNVVIHIASQLSRSTYGKDERRPTMADLSESAGIEKVADRIILFWAPKEKQDMTPGSRRRMIEAILEKNRHGKKGLIFELVLDEKTLRIAPDQASYHPPIPAHPYLPGQDVGARND